MEAPYPRSPTGRVIVAAMVTASSSGVVGSAASRVDNGNVRTTPAASFDSLDADDPESQHPLIMLETRTNTLSAGAPSPPPIGPGHIEANTTAAERWQNRKAMVRKLWTTLVASSS